MRKVAVFGNTGGGKSTLARQLAERTGLPFYPLDRIQFQPGGDAVPHEEYLKAHAELLEREAWIIDGFGCIDTAWERFAHADTLVYVDLPIGTHLWWVTKRLFKGSNPEGWPDRSPLLASTFHSYRVIWRCHRHLTPKYRQLVRETRDRKGVHHLRSPAEMKAFLASATGAARGGRL